MKIVSFEKDADMNMSSYKGVIKTTYDSLVEIFGYPDYTDADPNEKVNAEWAIEAETDDGDFVKFSIYNWKTEGVPTGVYDWHIGGYSYDAVEAAYELIK